MSLNYKISLEARKSLTDNKQIIKANDASQYRTVILKGTYRWTIHIFNYRFRRFQSCKHFVGLQVTHKTPAKAARKLLKGVDYVQGIFNLCTFI
jgi:hypothetical protein